MLQATNLHVSLSGAVILDAVDLQLPAGQVMVVLGPNGTGKTTLLKALTGELSAQRGNVLLHGRTINRWRGTEIAQRLAVLPQHSTLSFPFTAEEVVLLGRTTHSSGQQRDLEIVREALALVDGSYLATRYYPQLSGGEKQRVQLARVLAQIWEPVAGNAPGNERFLILDEPTSSFDLSHRQLMLDVIQHFARQGVGILMVSHDLNLAAQCADQVMLLSCGRVTACGPPHEVLNTTLLRKVFMADIDVIDHPKTGQPLIIY